MMSVDLFPCELLFVHRDAEQASIDGRAQEIREALEQCQTPPVVCVIPVRMQEAWLLFDEAALRKVSVRPRGDG